MDYNVVPFFCYGFCYLFIDFFVMVNTRIQLLKENNQFYWYDNCSVTSLGWLQRNKYIELEENYKWFL